MPSLSELSGLVNSAYQYPMSLRKDKREERTTLADLVESESTNRYRETLNKLSIEDLANKKQMNPLELQAKRLEIEHKQQLNPLDLQAKQQQINREQQIAPLDIQAKQQQISREQKIAPLDLQAMQQQIKREQQMAPLDVQAKRLEIEQQPLINRGLKLSNTISEKKLEQENQPSDAMLKQLAAIAGNIAMHEAPEKQSSVFSKTLDILGKTVVDPATRTALAGLKELAPDLDAIKAVSLLGDPTTRDKGIEYLQLAKSGFTATGIRSGESSGWKESRELPSEKNPGSGLVDVVGYDDKTGQPVLLASGVPSESYLRKSQEGLASANQAFASKLNDDSITLENEKFGLAQANQIVQNLPTEQGLFSDYKVLAREMAGMIPGMKSLIEQDSVGPSQVVNSILSGLRLESIGGGSLTGVSNYEQQIIKEKLPAMTQSPEGFALTMQYRNSFIDRKQALNEHIQQQYNDSLMRNKPVNLQTEAGKWLKSHPIKNFITQEMEDQTRAIIGGSTNATGSPRALSRSRGGAQTTTGNTAEQPATSGSKTYFSSRTGYELTDQDLRATYAEAKASGYDGSIEDFRREYGFEAQP